MPPQGPPATPPRRSPGMLRSTPPLGRSTHLERIKQAREEKKEEDVDNVTPLPIAQDEGLVPRFFPNGMYIVSDSYTKSLYYHLTAIQAESSYKSSPDGGAERISSRDLPPIEM